MSGFEAIACLLTVVLAATKVKTDLSYFAHALYL